MDSETRQRLLELVYDLLPEEEAAELRGKIESDPDVAAAYREAQQTARLLAEAARLPAGGVQTVPFGKVDAVETKSSEPSPLPGKTTTNGGLSLARCANWTVGLAAAALVLISVGGWFYHREKLDAIAAEHLRLVVTGPSTLQAGIDTEYLISTTAINGQPLPAKVEVALSTQDGKRLKSFNQTADEHGRLQVAIPAELNLPPQTHLRVVAWHGDEARKETAETTLTVEPALYDANLTLDRPLYQPGDTLRYRSLVLSRFGLKADRDVPVHFEIRDPAGAVVAGSASDMTTQSGVADGVFNISSELPGGQYTFSVRAADGSFSEQKRSFFVRRYRLPRLKKELEFLRDSYGPGQTVVADFKAQRAEGGAAAGAKLRVVATVDGRQVFEQNAKTTDAGTLHVEFKLPDKIEHGDGQLAVIIDDGGSRETQAKTIPINLGKLDVAFYPEGGDLVAGLENRVYFVARDPQGKPVDLTGELVAESSGEQQPVAVRTVYEGMGAFRFTPMAGGVYRLKIAQPSGVVNEPKLPAVSTEREVVLDAGVGVFAADKPLEFSVRTAKPGMPLVVAAYCRGVQVGEQPVTTKGISAETNSVTIPLEGTIGGVIRLTVYDYSVTPPKPVAERLVYRRPAQKLNVKVTNQDKRYAPGEAVDLSLLVTDENGTPTPAMLGAAVVDDALLNLADDRTPAMPTHFLLTSEIEKPEDLENADFYLSDQRKGDTQAAEALDLLLGTQGWRRFAEKSLPTIEAPQGEDRLAKLAVVGAGQPPYMYDNIEKLGNQYKESLAAYQADRTPARNTLTAVSFLGGLGLVLLVAMLGLMRIVSGMHLWVPAVGATTCCLIVGAILMNPDRLVPDQGNTVAFQSYQASAPKIESLARANENVIKLGEEDAVRLNILQLNSVFNINGGDWWSAPNAPYLFVENGALLLPNQFGFCSKIPNANWGVQEEMLNRNAFVHNENLWAMQPGYLHYNANGGIVRWADDDGANALAYGKRKWPEGEDRQLGLAREDMPALVVQRIEVANREPLGRRVIVREYVHRHRTAGRPGVRSDFAETLYWNPMLLADAQGRAAIRFDLSDAVTAFRLTADAHSNGRIGAGRAEIISRIPFNLEPKLPLEVNAGDRIDLPVAVVNDTKGPLPVELKLDCGKLVALNGLANRKLTVPAEQRRREYFMLNVTGEKGQCEVKADGAAGTLTDAVVRQLAVVPPGFPKVASYSGQLSGPKELVVKLPEQWVPGSLDVSLSVFPSSLANLKKGLDGILQEPNGCFEQASTSNYPNVMTMQYMQQHAATDPDVVGRTKDLLKRGYAKLTGYECKQHGYEWFGGDPGHEALTAYGLMQFRDMQKVYDVDAAMLNRTAEWLMARRDGKGGFQRNTKALDSFGQAPAEVTDAYITWALSETGQSGIDAEVKHAIELGQKSDDPYVLALAASAAANANQKGDARKLLEKLAKSQADDGHLDSRQGSITRSGGLSLQVETTSLAALAWLKSPDFAANANKAVDWLVGHRQGGGGFGSTQATILALKALVAHAEANRQAANAGKLTVEREGRVLSQYSFSAGIRETIVIDGLEASLKTGDNRLAINLTGDNRMPYVLNVSYRTLKPESSEACPVRLVTRLARSKVKAGETVALNATLTNATDQGQPMTVAILGLPAGLEPRADQLEELKKAGAIDYYETRPREIIFYWRSLAPRRQVPLKFDLQAAVPGRYTGPASRAYLYYTPENKQWRDPLTVEIAP